MSGNKRIAQKNEPPRRKQRGIRCHAGLDKPAPAIGKPGVSSLDFWIPVFTGMTIRRKRAGYEKENQPNQISSFSIQLFRGGFAYMRNRVATALMAAKMERAIL
jgi:hypothetical protein